ncbi:hypothetical protein Misp06_03094 [Microbulbifer sp. NBRC 101763]|uniref:hypothetical protein n=1 Tax=unclassified Microbulbifer TaxID=2619833 RepID=UPI0030A06945
MNQVLISLVFLFASSLAFACTAPKMGPEFDKLIKVEKVASNTFQTTISMSAEGLNYGAEATVEYYPANSEHRFGEYSKRVHLKEKGTEYVSTFELKKIEGHIPFLQVFWYPEGCCLCGAFGKSNDLTLE